MSSTLNINKQLTNEGWTITATISPGGTIPQAIFVYENTGTTDLGVFQGIVGAIDLARIQIWNFVIIPVYGNKYVRHTTGTILVSGATDPDDTISRLSDSVSQFSKDFQAIQTSAQTITIT